MLKQQQNNRHLIIAGHDAPKDRFPYYAALDYGNGMILSGALIAPDIVISAGHVLPKEEKDIDNIRVRIGAYQQQPKQKDKTYSIRKVIRHPDFNEFEEYHFSHDVLLFQLNEIVNDSASLIIPINRSPDIPTTGADLQIMGFGWTNASAISVPETLQVAQLNAESNKQCRQHHTDQASYAEIVDETHLCTSGGPHNERDGCAWDSGDPVVWTSSSNTGDQDILVGLGSWGEECADPNFPGVQTRISWAADWIDTHVCQLSRDPPADFNCHGLGKSPLSPVNEHHHVVPIVGTCLLLVVGCLIWFQKVKKQQQYPLQEEQFVSLKSTYGATEQA